MNKRPEKDLENPPGQIVNPVPGTIRTLADYIKQIERREQLDDQLTKPEDSGKL